MEEQGGNTSNESRSSDHSAALAEKLLEGWALLQEHCPQCLTPLVRNRQRKMFCVACAQWVVTQSEAAEKLARERVEKGGAESSDEPLPPPSPLPGPSSVPVSSSQNLTEIERQIPTPLPDPSPVRGSSSQITTENDRQVQIIDLDDPSRPSVGTSLSLSCTQDHQQTSNKGETLVIPKASTSLPRIPRPSIAGVPRHVARPPSSPPRAYASMGHSTAIGPPRSLLTTGMGNSSRASTTLTLPTLSNADASLDFAGATNEAVHTAATTPLALNPVQPPFEEVCEVLLRRKRKQASEKARRAKLAIGNTPMVRDNWTLEEFKALAEAKRRLDDEIAAAKGKHNLVTMHERWHRIAEWAKEKGVMRTPLQCRDKWENHFPRFKKIVDWERAIPSGLSSYWQMDSQDRKSNGLPASFDRSMYDILEAGFGRDVLVEPGNITIDSSSQTLVNNGSKSKEIDSNVAGHVEEEEGSSARDNNSTGKKRRNKEARQSIFMRDYFEDISRNLMEEIQKTAMKRTKLQAQMQELLAIQEQQAKVAAATEDQLDHQPKTLEQVLPNVSVILSHKLEEIGNALLATQDLNELRLLMNALRECFHTVEALKKLQGV